ncbi:hypothetical protein [Koleobacter methoxysyntrophicus]|uniref:hypothetical protein n=1 Tax=Koleobacter methoxysyntrophicus TaxID=2751313 RepID=UPI0019D60128|nr:hypothetical protein [Koleobacter methoxysyntrophicus]
MPKAQILCKSVAEWCERTADEIMSISGAAKTAQAQAEMAKKLSSLGARFKL